MSLPFHVWVRAWPLHVAWDCLGQEKMGYSSRLREALAMGVGGQSLSHHEAPRLEGWKLSWGMWIGVAVQEIFH